MKKYQKLSIESAILDEEQLKRHLEKMAMQHTLKNKSDKNTYPIPVLLENYFNIKEVYQLLNEHIKLGISIHQAGERILDNFYIIEEQVNAIKNCLSIEEYINLPAINGFARIYVLAREFVIYTDGAVTKEGIETFFNAYESKRALLQSELYVLPTMLQIALIEHIRTVSQKIIAGQLQKFKVESLVERIIKNKDINKQKFYRYKNINLNNEATSYVEYLTYLLKKMGKERKNIS